MVVRNNFNLIQTFTLGNRREVLLKDNSYRIDSKEDSLICISSTVIVEGKNDYLNFQRFKRGL
jgi:hypothetical protein